MTALLRWARAQPALLVAVFVPALVLACDPGGFYPFGPAKWLVLTAGLPVAAAWLLLGRPARWAPRPTLALGAVVVAMAIAAAIGEDPLYAWIGTPERRLGVLTWALVGLALVVGQSTTEDDRRLVTRSAVLAGLGLGLAAMAEAVEVWPHTLDAGSRLGGTFGSPAYLGAGVALLLPVALGVAADPAWSRGWRLTAGAAGASLGFAALGSGARAGWVGLAIAVVVVGVARRDRLPSPRVLLLGGAVAVAALGVVAVASPVGDRIGTAFDTDSAGGAPGRLDEWRVATRTLAEHPLTGVGPEGYRIAFRDGVDRAYEAEHGRDPLPDRAHSGPLDIALAGGPLGLAAWLALLAALAGPIRRALRSDQPALAGLGAGLVAYGGGQLLLFPLAELEPVAAVLAGMVVTATATAPTTTTAVAASRARVVPRPVPIALAVLAVGALVAGGFEIDADRQADQAAEAQNRLGFDDAVRHAQRAVDLRPDILRNHLLLAATLEADQRGVVAALGAVDDALDLSPGDPIALRRRAELLVERAAATLVPAHIEAARSELDRQRGRDPNNTELWILTGVMARLAGDPAGARAAWEQASAIDPGDPVPQVAIAQLVIERIGQAIAAAATTTTTTTATGDGTG